MNDSNLYNISVRAIEENGETEFEARVREFPHVVTYEDTADAAYDSAIACLSDVLTDLENNGKSIPAPIDPGEVDTYSGRVTLRIPKTLHRSLSEEADRENTSLNQYLVSILAYSAGNPFTSVQTAVWKSVDNNSLASPFNMAAMPNTIFQNDLSYPAAG